MDKLKYVKYGKTLEEYKRKYGKYHDLISFSQEQVDEFFKKWGHDRKGKQVIPDAYLITERKWWFIENRYYEVPKLTRKNNLIKAAILLLLLCGIGGATAGTLIALNNGGGGIASVTRYKVTYDCGEGGKIGDQNVVTVDEKQVIQTAPMALKDGFVLLGWGLDNLSEKLVTFPYKISGPTTFYAKWQVSAVNTVRINFKDGDEDADVNPVYVSKGSALGSNTLSTPTKTDHEFEGWYYDKKLNNAFDYAKPINENLVLYAKFKKNAFTLKFKTIGGQPAGTSPTSEDNVYQMNSVKKLDVEPYTEVDADNQGFYGWKDPKDPTKHITYPFTVTEDNIILEADIRNAPAKFTVAFKKEDKTTLQSISNAVQVTTAPDAPVRDGFKFTGWKNEKTEEIVNFPINNGLTLTEDTSFIATYQLCAFDVTLKTNVAGTIEEVETRQGCSKIQTTPANPKFYKDNYKIAKWVNDDGDEVTFPLEITKTCTITAIYSRSSYEVDFYDGETNGLISKIGSAAKVEANDTPQLSKINNSLYWGYKNDKGKIVEISFPITVENYTKGNSLNLYSIWKKDKYNLVLNYPDNIHKPLKFTDKKKIKLNDLKKYEYQASDKMCVGWSKVKPGSGTQTLITDDIDLNSDTEIYAVYASKIFNLSINYVDKNGEKIKNVDKIEKNYELGYKTEKISKPQTIEGGERKDYNFSHWAKSKATIATPITQIDIVGDTDIYAVYSDAFYGTYEYIIEGETEFKPIDKFTQSKTTITKEDVVSRMPDLTSDGYVRKPNWYYCKQEETDPKKLIEIKQDTFVIDGFYRYVCIYVPNSFDVTFRNEDDTLCKSLTGLPSLYVVQNKDLPSDPKIKGTTFNGFVEYDEEKKEEVGETVDFATGYTIQNKNVTFRAVSDRATQAKFKIPDAYKSIAHFEDESKTDKGQEVIVKDVTLKEMTTSQYSGGIKLVITNNNYALDGWMINNTRAAFPYTDARDRRETPFIANFAKVTEMCSVHLKAGSGQFSDHSKQILLTPKLGTKYSDFIQMEGYETPTLTNFIFKNWTIYDQVTQKYIDVPENTFVFNSDTTLFPKFVEEIKDTPGTEENFTTDDNWATVAHWAEKGESAFVSHYSFLNSNIENIVGKKRKIALGAESKEFEVSVVGTNHDTISGSTKKALLTFGLLNTPYSSGYNIGSSSGLTNNWANSSARKKLKENGLFYETIDSTVINHAQTVNKSTRKGTSDTTKYKTLETTQDKFFLFSGTELGLTAAKYNDNLDSSTISEGTTYKAFVNSTATVLKRKLNGTVSNYWLRSPYNNSFREAPLGAGVNWIQGDSTKEYTFTAGELYMKGSDMPSYYTDTAKAYIFGFNIGVNS